MSINLNALWDVLDKLLEAGNEFVEDQVEKTYQVIHEKMKQKVDATTTNFDNRAMETVEIGLRDKLNELYPLDKYPKN